MLQTNRTIYKNAASICKKEYIDVVLENIRGNEKARALVVVKIM